MEISWLEDFIALADCGNFSRAAQSRSKSQPAFSRRVQMLESWVGVSLFNRDTHRVELTPAGERFRPLAEDVIRQLALGRESAKEIASTEVSTIKFASTHALSMTFFPDWLQEIERTATLKGVISLVTDNMQGCEQFMLRGQVHFLLCHHHPSATDAFATPYFQFLDVGSDTLVPVSAPVGLGTCEPLHALPGDRTHQVPYLAYSSKSGMGRIIAASGALDTLQAGLSVKFTSHVATILMTMTKSGKGLAWLPQSLIQPALDAGELVRAGDGFWDIPVKVRVYRPRARQSLAAENLWSTLLQAASRQTTMDAADNVISLQGQGSHPTLPGARARKTKSGPS